MRHAHAIALRLQVLAGRFGQRHAAVLSPRAAHGDGQLLLAFGHVARHDAVEQRPPPLLELDGLLAVHHVVAHGRVEPGQGAQRRVVVGVRQEAHVHDQVGVAGRAVLEAERVHRDGQPPPLLPCGEQFADGGAQLLRQHGSGVDHVVRQLAHAEEQVALSLDALFDARAVLAQGMAAARGLVARDQLLVGRVQKQDAVLDAARVEAVQLVREPAEERPVARVAHHGDAALPCRLPRQLRHPAELEQVADEAGRRLSTQKYPRSSNTCMASVRPAPLMPLTMTSSGMSSIGKSSAAADCFALSSCS